MNTSPTLAQVRHITYTWGAGDQCTHPCNTAPCVCEGGEKTLVEEKALGILVLLTMYPGSSVERKEPVCACTLFPYFLEIRLMGYLTCVVSMSLLR